MIYLLFCLLFVIGLVLSFGFFLSAPVYKGPISDHFDGKKFRNPHGKEAGGFKDVLKYIVTKKAEPVSFDKTAYVRSDFRSIDIPSGKFRITFVNHSTFLIETEGLNILTDPIWSRRCSPFQFAGPGRLRLPGIPFENLPKIDLILLSHNHYDHLDKDTVIRLHEKHNPQFIVPLGVSGFLKKLGIERVDELDWWTTQDYKEYKITGLPANHFSGRGLFDRDRTLWCGYLLEIHGRKLYFAGDSGYSNIFKEIGSRVGGIDVSLIPIGAYKPEWFMGPIHVTPKEAMFLHKDVQSKQSIAMHFGCFPLADDNPESARRLFRESLISENIKTTEFMLPQEGKDYIL